ncbi:efflux RND transporter periplasmic adaptor subunit [uncultured Algimonas sp.]|uniref:efflux RND transporter periplasmic adaptor subunit n=1 Tax=uncultured Algimonas sp. TaxID=1547920 RepID=UPI00260DDB60|nr:efflux RND transporter periplasmic adaptor subunit [uncultured Algimonas sp.]
MDDFEAETGTGRRQAPRKRRLLTHRILAVMLPLIVIGGAVGATVAMSALAPEPEETDDPIKALPVLTALAEAGTVQLSVTTQGEVQPRTEIALVAQVPGRITYMSPDFLEGGQFRRGDLLVRIDPAEYRLRVTQAKANVSQAETVLARERSEADLARMDWEDLGSGQAATPLTLRQPQMAEAAAQLESAKAQLAEAELQLSRTQIHAPFDGRVTERQVDAGEFVGPNGSLGRVYATDIMDVRLPLTQSDLRQAGLYLGYAADMRTGIPVTLSTDVAGRRTEWTGRITRTDARFDSQSRVLHAYVEVRDAFAEGRPPLAPGLFVDAAIAGPTLDDVVTVPRAALRGTGEIYVANADGTLAIREVEVQSSDRDRAVLKSGVSAGENVVVSPIRGAADGMKVEVVDPAQTTAGA